MASAKDRHIVIGEQPDRPAITVRPSQDFASYEAAKQRDIDGDLVSRLGSTLQALPTLLSAGEASGRQLMEVVVNGDLVRAADGNGFRAFAMGPKGVKEQARLFRPERLQNVINAAAVWQVASVVVAQKHLADISRKLDAIGEGVTHISRFLCDQRRAQIQSAVHYLGQARTALKAGEMSTSVRTEVERCERDLNTIQIHLHTESRNGLDELVRHADTLGTDELAQGIAKKIRAQEALLQDLALCIQARICAWHVFVLFPGEQVLKEARCNQIQEAVKEFGALAEKFDTALDRDIRSMHSAFNLKSTLERRREALTKQKNRTVQKIRETYAHADRTVEDTRGLLLEHDPPIRMLLQYTNGVLEGASLAS